jgi:hypothetical protein
MRMKVMIFLLRRGSVQGLKGLLPKLQETGWDSRNGEI